MDTGPITSNTKHSVSCKYLGWIFEVCREHKIPVSEVMRGVKYPEEAILNENNYVDWVTFQLLVSNISKFLTQEEIISLGRDSFKSPIFALFAVLGRLLQSVQPLYRWIAIEILPRLYPISATVLHHSAYKLHLRLAVEQPLTPCPELFWVFEGQFASLSSLVGYRESDVTAIHRSRDSEYIITFARRRTFVGALKRWFKKPFDHRNSVLELREAQIGLLKKSRALEVENRLMDQAHTRISGLEQQNALLEQSLLDMIWMTDLNDRFTYVSPAIKSMFGYGVEESLRLNFFDLVAPSGDDSLFNILRTDTQLEEERSSRAQQSKADKPHEPPLVNAHSSKSRVFEVLAVRRDGSEFWCEIHRSFHYGNQGELLAITGVTRDITERKQNENEKVLLEKELAYSRHMESIGQLAGGIAHDFNNMLTTVLGFADLAREGLDAEHPITSYIEEISRGANRAADLVRQLLTFSKQQPMAPVPLDINDLVAELEPMLSRLVAENIELVVDSQSVPIIMGDASELERVILNLCINANDAMPDGGRLVISTREYLISHDDSRALKAGTDSFACISISDTGIGIEPEIQQRVLEPFFTTKPVGQGTGLGLAVTYSIVQQHSGFLDLVSYPNRGTTIKIFLPRSENTIGPLGLSHTDSPNLTSTGTILIVEDQGQVRRLLVQILQGNGFNVYEARDGIEAVSIFEQFHNQIDLVLMDIVMPKMGGREAVTLIRELDADAKVLFMTGYSDPKTDFAEASGHPVLRKPFSSGDVIRRVSELLVVDKVS